MTSPVQGSSSNSLSSIALMGLQKLGQEVNDMSTTPAVTTASSGAPHAHLRKDAGRINVERVGLSGGGTSPEGEVLQNGITRSHTEEGSVVFAITHGGYHNKIVVGVTPGPTGDIVATEEEALQEAGFMLEEMYSSPPLPEGLTRNSTEDGDIIFTLTRNDFTRNIRVGDIGASGDVIQTEEEAKEEAIFILQEVKQSGIAKTPKADSRAAEPVRFSVCKRS